MLNTGKHTRKDCGGSSFQDKSVKVNFRGDGYGYY